MQEFIQKVTKLGTVQNYWNTKLDIRLGDARQETGSKHGQAKQAMNKTEIGYAKF